MPAETLSDDGTESMLDEGDDLTTVGDMGQALQGTPVGQVAQIEATDGGNESLTSAATFAPPPDTLPSGG